MIVATGVDEQELPANRQRREAIDKFCVLRASFRLISGGAR